MNTCIFCGKTATTTVLADRKDGDQIVGSMEPYCGECLSPEPTKFGEAMRRHRLTHHLSLYALERHLRLSDSGWDLNLSIADISAIERGLRPVTDREARSLARELNADPVAWAALATYDRGEQPVIRGDE